MISIRPNISAPKTRKGTETFNKILSSAEKLFYKNSYHNTSVQDITEDAKLGVGTFYIYFPTKQDLYRYLVISYQHDIRLAINKAVENCKDRIEAEARGLNAYIDFIQQNPHIYSIIWQGLTVDPEMFKSYYESFSRSYVKRLNESIKNSEIRSDVDSNALSYILMGISTYLGLETLFYNSKMVPAEVEVRVDTVKKLLTDGLTKR